MPSEKYFIGADGFTVVQFADETHSTLGEMGLSSHQVVRLLNDWHARSRNLPPPPPPAERGWVCPKCDTANAPWAAKCCEGKS